MTLDIVDKLLIQWEEERPDLKPDSLGVVVRIQHLAKTLTDHATDALASLDLSMWEYDVLSALRRQGEPYELSAKELAIESRLSSGAMTNRIDRLADKGLLRRNADPHDRRAIRIQLTTKGRRLTAAAISLRLAAAEESLQQLSASECDVLSGLLRKLLVEADNPN